MTTGDTLEEPQAAQTKQTKRMGRWQSRSGGRNAPPPQSGGAVYGLGMIGALVYFVGTARSAQDYVLAFGKAMVWPALLVYKAFKRLDS